MKTRQVAEALRRIGKIDLPVESMIPSPLPYTYRNRVTVHVQEERIGFYERDSNHVIDIEQCPISSPEVNRALAELRANRPREGHYTLRAAGGPRVFTQTNDAVADALAELIRKIIPPNQHLLVDAYCGAGFFTKRLLDHFEQLVGIDWDRFAIAAAQKNTTDKETYIAGDVTLEVAKHVEPTLRDRTVMIIDPPATGLPEEVRAKIVDVAPATLVYVSCNPATLARDLRDLVQRYEIKSVQPLDMFPQTAEIEVAVHLQTHSSAGG